MKMMVAAAEPNPFESAEDSAALAADAPLEDDDRCAVYRPQRQERGREGERGRAREREALREQQCDRAHPPALLPFQYLHVSSAAAACAAACVSVESYTLVQHLYR